jgi:integrase
MTGKTRNNNLIPLRSVLRLRRRITPSTMIRPRSSRTPRSRCPNLTPSSCEQILADLGAHTPEPVVNYFTAAFFTGIRPSELIAIRWSDVAISTAVSFASNAPSSAAGRSRRDDTHRSVGLRARERELVALDKSRANELRSRTSTPREDIYCDEWSQYTGLNDCDGASNTLMRTRHACLGWVFRSARRIA